MLSDIKISIIVPVYNVAAYLDQCMQSILLQAYKNIEIILVNDGSTDESGILCEKYASEDSRIKYVYQANGGLSKARNTGLEKASGDYILFVDSDDWIDESLCLQCVNIIRNCNPDIIVFGLYKVFADKETTLSVGELKTGFITKEMAMSLLGNDSFGNYAWNKLYKKKLFDKVKYPVGRLLEDIGTTCYIFHEASKIYYFQKCLYYYRQRQNSIMHIQSHKRVKDEFDLRYEQIVFFKNKYRQAVEASNIALYKSAMKYMLWFEVMPECDSKMQEKADSILRSNEINLDKVGLMIKLCRVVYFHFPSAFRLVSKIINRKNKEEIHG